MLFLGQDRRKNSQSAIFTARRKNSLGLFLFRQMKADKTRHTKIKRQNDT